MCIHATEITAISACLWNQKPHCYNVVPRQKGQVFFLAIAATLLCNNRVKVKVSVAVNCSFLEDKVSDLAGNSLLLTPSNWFRSELACVFV